MSKPQLTFGTLVPGKSAKQIFSLANKHILSLWQKETVNISITNCLLCLL